MILVRLEPGRTGHLPNIYCISVFKFLGSIRSVMFLSSKRSLRTGAKREEYGGVLRNGDGWLGLECLGSDPA